MGCVNSVAKTMRQPNETKQKKTNKGYIKFSQWKFNKLIRNNICAKKNEILDTIKLI